MVLKRTHPWRLVGVVAVVCGGGGAWCGGGDGDGDGDSVMMMVAVAGYGGEYRRLAALGGGDRIGRNADIKDGVSVK
ncbi:hypothetical protein Tco_0506388 [Tanacetum coccineum]